MSDCTFQSYIHRINSIIEALSTVLTFKGHVNFTDSITGIHSSSLLSSGTAVFLRTTHPELKSSLNITIGATVYFVNLTCSNEGGAVYGENAVISIGINARVVFVHNFATYTGGAMGLITGTLNVDSNASLRFSHNSVHIDGGALKVEKGELIINTNANLNFSNNYAVDKGGAVFLVNTTLHVNTDAIHFYNNSGLWGGAMYFAYGTMYINPNSSVMLIMNTAQIQDGAIFIASGDHSIIVKRSAKLLFSSNSAFQGGALYVIPSLFAIQVGYQSSVQFINNSAFDVGGAVYSEMQSAAPCMFMVTDYSAELSFIGNYANHSVGHHMYGTSVRDYICDLHIQSVNKHGKQYCTYKDSDTAHFNISFHPDLNETFSPVSSTPWRVCLCDSNGKPQCANISQIFTNVRVYRGETFTLSASVVGYDFGTTMGLIHAGFLYSNPFLRLEKSQYNQPVSNSERCSTINYTVYSKRNDELLLLQTSGLPVSAYIDKEFETFKNNIIGGISNYFSHEQFGCIDIDLLNTPVFVNVTLLSGCPPGLMLNHDHTTCSCYSVLASNGFKCSIQNETGYLKWNNTVWVNATFNERQITVSSIIVFVHCTTASQVTKQSTLEMIPASSVPPIELVFCVVPARRTLAWQLDLLGALNVLTVITWHSYLPLLPLVSSLCSLSLHLTSLLLKDSLIDSSFMLTLYGPTKNCWYSQKYKTISFWSFFKFLSPGSTWTLELKPASLLDWMLIGRHGYSSYSHSTSGPLLVLSLLLAATPLASLTSLVAELFLF